MNEDKKSVSIYDLLMFSVDQTAGVAWIKLGLQPDPVTGEIDMDLAEAKVAIDVVAQLAEHMKARLDDADRRELENLVANLRMNFVEKSRG